MPIDRGDAVNLARNIERNPHLKVTSIGVLGLASAVLAMDEALRASPSEAEGKDLIAYAARYSWLRDKSANQYEHPIAVSQTRTEGGMNYVGPLLGKALDEAIDAVLSRSSSEPSSSQ
jgi:hypothetical protein